MRLPEIDKGVVIAVALVALFVVMSLWVVKWVGNEAVHSSVEAQMGRIHQAVVHYAVGNGGFCPSDLGLLADGGYCKDFKLFRIKGSSEPLPANASELRSGSCDFIYLGKGRKLEFKGGPALKTSADEGLDRVSGMGGNEFLLLVTKAKLPSGAYLAVFSDRSFETYADLPSQAAKALGAR